MSLSLSSRNKQSWFADATGWIPFTSSPCPRRITGANMCRKTPRFTGDLTGLGVLGGGALGSDALIFVMSLLQSRQLRRFLPVSRSSSMQDSMQSLQYACPH